MKRILVAVENYPDNYGCVALMYVHTRNKAYSSNGIDVTVLSFHAREDYFYDGIRVISPSGYLAEKYKYDVLVCHTANIRHHYLFLKKHGDNFESFVFFFHGHEVLKIHKTYSKPYPYISNSRLRVILQNCYDDFKLSVWQKYYLSVKEKSKFVFVSNWMLEEFLKWTQISYEAIKDRCEITYNCIGKVFEEATFNPQCDKEFDFITIRSNLDGSKYCIDLVNKFAFLNPDMKFLVVGKGAFFDHYEKAPNITWMNQTMNHQEIIRFMQKSRCALMPTRTDAQGLMMCEMASTGMPLITSDIPVCHEVFDGFANVALIDNNMADTDLGVILKSMENKIPFCKNEKYYNNKTSKKEIEILKGI